MAVFAKVDAGDIGHETMSLKKREQEQPGVLETALQEFLRVERYGKAGRRELVKEHQQAESSIVGQSPCGLRSLQDEVRDQ